MVALQKATIHGINGPYTHAQLPGDLRPGQSCWSQSRYPRRVHSYARPADASPAKARADSAMACVENLKNIVQEMVATLDAPGH